MTFRCHQLGVKIRGEGLLLCIRRQTAKTPGASGRLGPKYPYCATCDTGAAIREQHPELAAATAAPGKARRPKTSCACRRNGTTAGPRVSPGGPESVVISTTRPPETTCGANKVRCPEPGALLSDHMRGAA